MIKTVSQNIEAAEELLARAGGMGMSADSVEALSKAARTHLEIARFKKEHTA